MTRYAILEGNMERLQKKVARIQNKCMKYGCDFHFAEVGEEFRQLKMESGEEFTARFVLVEAEGIAVVNGWKFIAAVEHTEKGNIINRACDIEVPERYYTSKPVCEHCKSKRTRKDTYIVMNEETGEFKQVGKSCLADFTHGMSAEAVASYTAMFDEIISGEAVYPGTDYTRYTNVKEFLHYVAECIRHFGYVKNDRWSDERSTMSRASDYYAVEHGGMTGYYDRERRATCIREMEECHFNAYSKESAAETEAALDWLRTQDCSSNYMHNLEVACTKEWDSGRNLGIAASLFPTYNRELEYQNQQRKKAAEEKSSEWVGEVGKRVEIKVKKFQCVTSWGSSYGYYSTMTYIWKITDEAGNIFTWKTSNEIPDNVDTIKGTVKEHKEYRGTKQTELTRCKCIEKPKKQEVEEHKPGTFDIDEVFRVFEAAAV